MDIARFATTQLSLLAVEQAAEQTEQTALIASLAPVALQRHGLALINLALAAQRTGLGGRTLLELEPDGATSSSGATGDGGGGGRFPTNGLRSGDVVRVAELPAGAAKKREKALLAGRGVVGVVHRMTESRLVVAVGGRSNSSRSSRADGNGGDDDDDDAGVEALVTGGRRLWAVKMADEATFRRMEQAMRTLGEMGEAGSVPPLVRVLFGLDGPAPADDLAGPIDWFDSELNDSQKRAVEFALGSKDIALIHGPPGTGKTQTLVEIVRQLTAQTPPKRVLVCGPSNIAVDNVVLRLPAALPSVRLGHPARLLPAVLARSLDVQTQTSDAGAIARDVRHELDALRTRLGAGAGPGAGGRQRLRGSARRDAWEQLRHLRGEFRQRESRATRELVAGSAVVLATLHGAGARQLRGERFDVLIIDEGSQALEAQCWIPLLLLLRGGGSRLVLAGDHMQLPPTVKSAVAKPQRVAKRPIAKLPTDLPTSLEDTLFARLLRLHGPGVKRLLTVQYRMHEAIMRFPSQHLYDSALIAHPSVAGRLLADLPHVGGRSGDDSDDGPGDDNTRVPIVFIDTQGGDFPEAPTPPSDGSGGPAALVATSHSNPLEAALAANHVHALVRAGVRDSEIAVLTPYTAQLALLVASLRPHYPGLELASVDAMQGREKEAIVLSLVRSNDRRDPGFLRDSRRLNVAMTRARRHLCVVGDSTTLCHAAGFLPAWLRWVESAPPAHVDVRYPDPSDAVVSPP